MHDVITKTLPANMALLALQREAAAEIEAKTAQRQDSAMIEADLSRGAMPPPPADEDPLAGVRDTLADLIEFASEDAINAGQALPGGRGAREPDVSGMDRRVERVLDEVRKLLTPTSTVEKINIAPDNGLLTSHNPDRRGVL